ncbi:uncharacterized protein BXZ73DRAFT_80127 [Epithele typhae]|uniref:uncharacterized protein n=1 Tax=Epithele typhae TaxID=378194 RepID=UPI002008C489|nr:uncharacterized protein BXZ73DRAFT_80127 [Epithele typhae]KAH9920555.1 hypothetical protein BXZ73DRAFT_80127 [Epithele typhae]
MPMHTLASTLSLPTELLVIVFNHILSAHDLRPTLATRLSAGPTGHMFEGDTTYLPALSILASVCRHWKDVIFGCPAFWSRVQHHTPSQHQLFLQRSSSTALFFHLRTSFALQSSLDLSQMLVDLAHRLCHLYLDVDDPAIDLGQLLDFPGETLRCLVVSVNPSVINSVETVRQVPLLRDHAPNLEALALVGYWCHIFPANEFPRLTHLFLERCDRVFDLEALISLLAGTPILQSLHLSNRLLEIQRPPRADNPAHTVSLSRIRTITIQNWNIHPVRQLLSRLRLPKAPIHTFLQFDISTNQYHSDPISPLLDPFLPALSLLGPACLHIQDRGPDAGILLEPLGADLGPSLLLEVYDSGPSNMGWHLALADFPRAAPCVLNAVVSLRLARSSTIDSVAPLLPLLLAHTPALTDLRLAALLATCLRARVAPPLRRLLLRPLFEAPFAHSTARADIDTTARTNTDTDTESTARAAPACAPSFAQVRAVLDRAGLAAYAADFRALPPIAPRSSAAHWDRNGEGDGDDESRPGSGFGWLCAESSSSEDEAREYASGGRVDVDHPSPSRWAAAAARGAEVRERFWTFDRRVRCACD